MDGVPGHVLGRFHDRLGERGVGVHGLGDRLGRRLQLQRGAGLGDQIGGVRSHDVHAEDLAVFLFRDDLHQAA